MHAGVRPSRMKAAIPTEKEIFGNGNRDQRGRSLSHPGCAAELLVGQRLGQCRGRGRSIHPGWHRAVDRRTYSGAALGDRDLPPSSPPPPPTPPPPPPPPPPPHPP